MAWSEVTPDIVQKCSGILDSDLDVVCSEANGDPFLECNELG